MKKYYLTIVIAFALFSCNEESVITEQFPKEVEVSLDYSFTESGSMTRAGSSVYTDFYNKYIKTKQLTPKNFILTFKNKETGNTSTIAGNWEKKNLFKLLTGEYEVTGTSYPSNYSSYICIDSLFMKFNENVNITNETESVHLNAIHDSYMLMFDKSDKKEVSYEYYISNSPSKEMKMKNIDGIYYSFFNKLAGETNYIRITRSLVSSISLDKIPFEKGKYYYFNDIGNSFNIPPMEEGN